MADDLWLALSIIGAFFFVLFVAWADVTRWHRYGEVDKKRIGVSKRPTPRDL